jgi:hypothetical protein
VELGWPSGSGLRTPMMTFCPFSISIGSTQVYFGSAGVTGDVARAEHGLVWLVRFVVFRAEGEVEDSVLISDVDLC